MYKSVSSKDYGDYSSKFTYKVINKVRIAVIYILGLSIIKASIVYYMSIPEIMKAGACESGNNFTRSINILADNGFYKGLLVILGLYVLYKVINKMINQYRLMYVMGSLYEIKDMDIIDKYGINRYNKLSTILENESIIEDIIRDDKNKSLVNKLNENNFYKVVPLLLKAERVKNLNEEEFKEVTNNFKDLTYISYYNKIVNNVLKSKSDYNLEIKKEKDMLETIELLSKQVKEEEYKSKAIKEYLENKGN